MAADLTLMAFDNTRRNRRVVAAKTGRLLLPGDEWIYLGAAPHVDRVVLATGVEVGFVQGDTRRTWTRRFYEAAGTEYDWFEVGPLTPDYLEPSLDYWTYGRVATPGVIATAMTLLNLPDGEYRRYWDRPVRVGKMGRRHYPFGYGLGRTPRRQHVKRWLKEHEGQLIFGEAW